MIEKVGTRRWGQGGIGQELGQGGKGDDMGGGGSVEIVVGQLGSSKYADSTQLVVALQELSRRPPAA